MLASNGVAEADVRFERAGGVLQRFEALKEGKHAGALLVTPFELIGQGCGCACCKTHPRRFRTIGDFRNHPAKLGASQS